MFNVRAFAVASAVLWGSAMLLVGWIAPFGYGEAMVSLISSVYIGYGPGFIGGLIGGFWGAIDGGIAGLVFAWLYNHLVTRFNGGAS